VVASALDHAWAMAVQRFNAKGQAGLGFRLPDNARVVDVP